MTVLFPRSLPLLASVVVLLALGPGLAPAQQPAKPVEDGKAILEKNCARCHATGSADASPLAQAPPFRDLHKKYPVAQLAEALAEGITTGHADMPEFIFEPNEIDAILAYLESLAGPN